MNIKSTLILTNYVGNKLSEKSIYKAPLEELEGHIYMRGVILFALRDYEMLLQRNRSEKEPKM